MITKELRDKIVKDVLSMSDFTSLSFMYQFNGTQYTREGYYRQVGEYLKELYGIDDFREEHRLYDEVDRRIQLKRKIKDKLG
jgi:hypothetical protein